MFEQIVIVDKTGLMDWALEKLKKYSKNPIKIYNDIPTSQKEIAKRIENADAVFVSWSTELNAEVLSSAKRLKYIGMCCSLYNKKSANVDIEYAQDNGIIVKGVRDYGDQGLVEYIISELIQLLKGTKKLQWKESTTELTGKNIGIIGMGATGKMLAERLQVFGANIYYFSRNAKPEVEKLGIKYLPLDELLKLVDIISLHLPKNSTILKENEFKQFGNGKILINTSLGFTFDKDAFKGWISNKSNYAIFDGDGIGQYKKEFENFENIISSKVVSGWTLEARERLSLKVLENIKTIMID